MPIIEHCMTERIANYNTLQCGKILPAIIYCSTEIVFNYTVIYCRTGKIAKYNTLQYRKRSVNCCVNITWAQQRPQQWIDNSAEVCIIVYTVYCSPFNIFIIVNISLNWMYFGNLIHFVKCRLYLLQLLFLVFLLSKIWTFTNH